MLVFDTNRGWWVISPSPEICGQSDPLVFEKRRLRPISAYNVSTVRAGEKVQLSLTEVDQG